MKKKLRFLRFLMDLIKAKLLAFNKITLFS